ncbi:putative caffeoylshikimate esterase [Iris pallida]|uniref:Caffeoylshikimate esterase n=1 Tax=Iris pallida TaxID=29817 RepID=A0AAX6FFU0_IRIPA|nr:putative caffeoylshikimate esterase [Iris pallida]
MVRHPIADANESSPFGELSPSEFYSRHSVAHTTSTFLNPDNLRIFTQTWTPTDRQQLLGTVCVVHGYTGESSWFVQLTSVLLAQSGFAVAAIDHAGHGFSDGLHAHVPSITPVVRDCVSFFDSFRSQHEPLPSFLYSESLGGAIALLMHFQEAEAGEGTLRRRRPYDGIVLNGAMCGISQKFKPPWPLEHLLSLAAALVPTWQVVPTRGSIPDVSFKVGWKRRLALASPRRRAVRPRAATAKELLRVCGEVQARFEEVTAPFLIVHGGEDVVCDPACAEELYRRASSRDKTIKIYPGMWHQLVGEPDEDVDRVFGDVVDWLKERALVAAKTASADAAAAGSGQ